MSALPEELPSASPGIRQLLLWTLRDSWTLTLRELSHIRREPTQLIGAVVFPGLMVLLFGYVFGSAIQVPGGGNYREYLMPGLFGMSAIIGLGATALLISKDVAQGVMDRFRSLPMAPFAVPFGRTAAGLLSTAVSLSVLALMGLVVGWRIHHGVVEALAAFGLILLVSYAVSWVSAYLGLLVSPETADTLVPIVFPISMLSNSFVPTGGMPGWLRAITDWNPISSLVQACRDLFGNPGAGLGGSAWPLAHPYLATLGWALVLLLVFAPLATRRYGRGR